MPISMYNEMFALGLCGGFHLASCNFHVILSPITEFCSHLSTMCNLVVFTVTKTPGTEQVKEGHVAVISGYELMSHTCLTFPCIHVLLTYLFGTIVKGINVSYHLTIIDDMKADNRSDGYTELEVVEIHLNSVNLLQFAIENHSKTHQNFMKFTMQVIFFPCSFQCYNVYCFTWSFTSYFGVLK